MGVAGFFFVKPAGIETFEKLKKHFKDFLIHEDYSFINERGKAAEEEKKNADHFLGFYGVIDIF